METLYKFLICNVILILFFLFFSQIMMFDAILTQHGEEMTSDELERMSQRLKNFCNTQIHLLKYNFYDWWYNHLYVLCMQLKTLRGKYDNYIVHSIIACCLKHKLFPGLKFAQVNFSDQNLTVDCHCCLRWRLCH